jgi:hypothetical protein
MNNHLEVFRFPPLERWEEYELTLMSTIVSIFPPISEEVALALY